MSWQDRAEKAQSEAQTLIDAAFNNTGKPMPTFRIPAQESDTDLVVSDYIRESAERIAFLEKALNQAVGVASVQLEVVAEPEWAGEYWRRHIGKDAVVFGFDDVAGLATEYPELAQYLRERDHIVDAQEMVGEDQK